jgi:ribosomal protein L37AE/L43A
MKVELDGDFTAYVASDSQLGTTYFVNKMKDGVWLCECADFKYNGKVYEAVTGYPYACKHIRAVFSKLVKKKLGEVV